MNKKTVVLLAAFALACILIRVVIGIALTNYRISGVGVVKYARAPEADSCSLDLGITSSSGRISSLTS